MVLSERRPVYLLFSGITSQYRFRAAKFAQGKGFVPTYPSIAGDFFAIKSPLKRGVDERTLLIKKCDEVWVFGDVSASMASQITTAKHMGKSVRFFGVTKGEFWPRSENGTY